MVVLASDVLCLPDRWFPVAYLLSCFGLYYFWWFTRWIRLPYLPSQWVEIPTPRSCCRLYVTESDNVRQLSQRVSASAWFRFKANLGAAVLDPLDMLKLLRLLHVPSTRMGSSISEDLDALLSKTRYYYLMACPPIGGYAARHQDRGDGFILGLCRALAGLPCIASSAAGHELMHFVQHAKRGVFDREWAPAGSGHQISFWVRTAYELHACVLGGPLVFFASVVLLFWPIVVWGGV